jgi:hypothetical protein
MMDMTRKPGAVAMAVVVLAWAAATVSGCGDSGTSPQEAPNHVAELSASTTAAPPNTATGPELTLVPPAGAAVTLFQTDVAVVATAVTGDMEGRAEIGLRFQPVADRAADDYTDVIYLRIELLTAPGGLIARRFFYECTDSTCATASSVGAMTAGNWSSSGAIVTEGTTYTASIAWVPGTKIVTFSLATGGSPLATATVDLQQASSGSPALTAPFDVSLESFVRAFLTAFVQSGAAGGGDGSIKAHFDNVYVGTNGGNAVLFDNFDGATVFDSSKWIISGAGARIIAGG